MLLERKYLTFDHPETWNDSWSPKLLIVHKLGTFWDICSLTWTASLNWQGLSLICAVQIARERIR
jgi:hypothetical protein